MLRVLTPIGFVLALVAQLLPAAAPCHAHEHCVQVDCQHEGYDDGAGHHDEHWTAPDGDESRDRDELDTSCQCPCHAPRAATVTAEPASPVRPGCVAQPTAERCGAPGFHETDRPPPRA